MLPKRLQTTLHRKKTKVLSSELYLFSAIFILGQCSGKLRPREIRTSKSWFPDKFDFTGHNFPGNYDRSGNLRLEKVCLTSLVFLVN